MDASGGGGTGIRDGLKSHCPPGHVGSIPTRRIRWAPQMSVASSTSSPGSEAMRLRWPASRASLVARSAIGLPGLPSTIDRTERPIANPNVPAAEYAYLLGMHLGDGVISHAGGRCYRLRITTDASYPGVIAECSTAMQAVVPHNRVSVRRRTGERAVEMISAYSNAWSRLFPQHGPGKKHERRIVLAEWQEAIVRQHPTALPPRIAPRRRLPSAQPREREELPTLLLHTGLSRHPGHLLPNVRPTRHRHHVP